MQWMFLLESIPAVLLGIATIFYLAKSPSSAKFLMSDEQEWLLHRFVPFTALSTSSADV